VLAFFHAIDVNSAIGEGMMNIRYGLFSVGLIHSGTSIILALFLRNKN